jgi:hypothetical protein
MRPDHPYNPATPCGADNRDAAPDSGGAYLQALGLRMASTLCGCGGRYKRSRAGAPARVTNALEAGAEGASLVALLQVRGRLAARAGGVLGLVLWKAWRDRGAGGGGGRQGSV